MSEQESDPQAEELRVAREEAKDLYDRLARVSAELDNFRKRQQRESDRALAFANERLLLELIPVVDSLDRAVAADPLETAGGMRLVKKQLEDTLARFGAVPFTTLGLPFDPARAEAISVLEDDTIEPGTVMDEHQRGWTLNGRLVRPARVVVSAITLQ